MGGSNIVTKSTPRVPSDGTLITIGYKYTSHNVMEFIADEGSRST